jgi:hypothetical protein
MLRYDSRLPALLPMLSRGKHRSPRKGACFMEFASLLAGERWSDHPACTHPLLAALARHVNDSTSDAGRQRLAELIPSVIGLTGEDLHVDARIALGSATMALPVRRPSGNGSWRSRCWRANASWLGWTGGRGRAPGAEPLGLGAGAGRRGLGQPFHARCPALRQALSPAGCARHRP